ncbi:hypothetical protein PybrP1_001842 [[Pythium] brassicae (nom. inval.)]|nr:hypothetical protein PybrP1_001842 [[Pythium] brassicae (nom. inval.)]
MASLRSKPRTAAAVVHDGPPKSPPPPNGATQQQKKRRVAGVGQLAVAIATVVVALAAAVLASDPLDWSLRRLSLSASENRSIGARDADVERFLEWFDGVGGVRHKHIGIATFASMGRGAVAMQEISEHDQLLFVPMNVIICRETIARVAPPALKHKFQQLMDAQDELLTAFVLLESLKMNEPSLWGPYLQLLPAYTSVSATSPLFYSSQDEIDALQDERMIAAAQQERRVAKRAFQRFRRLFRASIAAVPSDLEPRYLWARFLVSSRAFTIHGQRYLVPFGDVFNGQRHASARRFDNGLKFLQYHRFTDHGMVVLADRAVAAGVQVFEDYGDNSNYVYFLHHGFVLTDNPFDCASLRLPPLDESPADARAMKLRVLGHFRLENGPSACVTSDGSISQEGLQLAQFYFTVARTSAENMRNACALQHNYEKCFLSTAASLAAGASGPEFVDFVARAVREQLATYATSLNEDEEALARTAPSTNVAAAIAFRMSRKRILREALGSLQSELAADKSALTSAVSTTASVNEPTGDDDTSPTADDSIAARIDRFLEWIEEQNLPTNHLTLRFVSDAMGYGAFATKALQKNEPYLSVPVEMVMNLQSAARSESLRRLVRRLGPLAIEDDSLLLALHLLDEAFGPARLGSRWKPCVDVLPSVAALERSSPLFFDEQAHMALLAAADLHVNVQSYRSRVRQAFKAFKQQVHATTAAAAAAGDTDAALGWITEARFLWANAILDSRSIWWSGQRHLVPLLDMVNCLDLGAGHAAHRTDLVTSDSEEGAATAVTRASWHFAAGEQVVENYAQPNYIYLQYHGFVLRANKHDCAHVALATADRVAIDALPHPRKRALMEMLEALALKTWTPELCVDPRSAGSVARFAQVAFITETPLLALEAGATPLGGVHGEGDLQASSREIHAGLSVVAARLATLETGLSKARAPEVDDHSSRMIRAYLGQQHELLTAVGKRLQQALGGS